ncbi:hypothetical protein A5693_24840 [Mycobacterium sp. E1319]|nr:hypothetical protein A5693_24840 [Mycobacterium sp. E1319]
MAQIYSDCEEYAATGGPLPGRLPIAAITGKLIMGQYEAIVQWNRLGGRRHRRLDRRHPGDRRYRAR